MLSVPEAESDWIVLTSEELPIATAIAWATTARAGAVVSFAGVVRDHAEGRDDVFAMTYEAYEEPARRRLGEIVVATRQRWPDLERLAVLHRLGELKLGEASVLVVASSPHRDVAFDAARFVIDTLKVSVPIWKKEHFGGDSAWALNASEVRPVHASRIGE